MFKYVQKKLTPCFGWSFHAKSRIANNPIETGRLDPRGPFQQPSGWGSPASTEAEAWMSIFSLLPT